MKKKKIKKLVKIEKKIQTLAEAIVILQKAVEELDKRMYRQAMTRGVKIFKEMESPEDRLLMKIFRDTEER